MNDAYRMDNINSHIILEVNACPKVILPPKVGKVGNCI